MLACDIFLLETLLIFSFWSTNSISFKHSHLQLMKRPSIFFSLVFYPSLVFTGHFTSIQVLSCLSCTFPAK
ncbi:hypothetical protein NC651_000270 [Populus alba x Populus x berolinensis]|nr:hypothetical protein NC651_000270 [Populus alba x Populus x berolinensis]